MPGVEDLRKAGHIPALDGLRGTAVLMVLAVHLGGGRHSSHLPVRLIADTLRIGWAGVTLFFVLSGFLISGLLWDSFANPGWWKRFYIRRSLRIFPLYYLALLYALVFSFVISQPIWAAFAVHAFYLQDIPWLQFLYARIPPGYFQLDHFWSLAVEEQFYLLWPFLLFAFRARRQTAMNFCLGAIVLSTLFRVALLHTHASLDWCYISLPARSGDLFTGAWLALAIRGTQAQTSRVLRFAPLAAGIGFIGIVIVAIDMHGSLEHLEPAWLSGGTVLLSITFAALIALCLRPSLAQKFFQNSMLRWYGKISYGVYVFHWLLAPMVRKVLRAPLAGRSQTSADLITSVSIILVGTLTAWVSFNTYEAYFLRLKDRIGHRRQAVVPTAP